MTTRTLPPNPDPTIARAARRARGLTQQAVADASGIERAVLSRVERGELLLDPGALNRLAVVLGQRPDDLLQAP